MTLTTKLEAINQMLLAIGASPINSLDISNSVDVALAKTTLDNYSRELQSLGWHFNTEHDVPLTRDANKEILLPTNVVKVDINAVNLPSGVNPVQRGSKLYDTANRRYTFDQDLKAEVVYLLDWDLLPEPARNFIAKSAARQFQALRLGDSNVSSELRDDENKARIAFLQFDEDTADYNILTNPDVASVTLRRPPLRQH